MFEHSRECTFGAKWISTQNVGLETIINYNENTVHVYELNLTMNIAAKYKL